MGDVVQLEASGTATTGGAQAQAGAADRGYVVVPYTEKARHEDLYGYRETMNEPAPAEGEQQSKARSKRALPLLPILLLLALVALALLLIPKMAKPNLPARYIDLGTRRFDSAGLGGRLIARWEGSAGYQLYIDPLDPQQTAQFQAVAVNPPHPLTLVLRLLNSEGEVACEKEIALPTPPPLTDSAISAAALAPMQTASGDTVENIAGDDGQVAEITVTGGLPCSLKEYKSLAGWEFFTNFPTMDDQKDWLKQQGGEKVDAATGRKVHFASGARFNPRIQHLPAPIDGDGVIVGDNRVRGTIDTSDGRVFFVGVSGLRNSAAEWQIFPAAIHFRCEKNGSCVLTRENSHTTLQARLIK